MALRLFQVYGFNARIGQLAFPQDQSGGFPEQRPYSDATAQAMDEEAKLMVDAAYERTLKLITERKKEVTALAELLLEKETVNHDDIISVIGERPFKADDQYAQYISNALGIKSAKERESAKEEEEGSSSDEIPPNLAPV